MRLTVAFLAGLFCSTVASAQTAVTSYRFFDGDLESPFQVWNEARSTLQKGSSIDSPRRPVLPGVHGRNLELLQDYYVRYYPKATQGGLRSEATRRIANSSEPRISKLRGFMAEAIYLEKHPEWKYPSISNTRQVDVYRSQPDGRRGIHGAQIKFHIDGNPALYARDMLRYPNTQRFVVPDDHVEPLKSYLRSVGREDRIQRVYGNGETSNTIDQRTRQGVREAISIDQRTRQGVREVTAPRTASYILLGAATALELGPVAYQLLTGELTTDEAQKRLDRAAPPLGMAMIADQALKLRPFGSGNLRGAAKGNAIVGTVYFLVDTGMLINEYGGVSNALHHPQFWIDRGTVVIGLAGTVLLCSKVGAAITGVSGGVGVPVGVGTALACTIIVGSAVSIAGNEISELLQSTELRHRRAARYEDAQKEISKELECLGSLHEPVLSSRSLDCKPSGTATSSAIGI